VTKWANHNQQKDKKISLLASFEIIKSNADGF
jgi:hypothetical protein